MAGKKERKQEFQQNPFKRLRGFCVSPPDKAQTTTKSTVPVPELTVDDEADLFATEMSRLGVADRTGADAPFAEVEEEEAAAPNEPVMMPPSEHDLFLASLGTLDAVFVDGIPEDEEISAAPRRMRQLRRGELVPEAKLDLHGLARSKARERVCHFLDNSVYHGYKTVLIVTGRGKGSGGEPVLRTEIERFLRHEATAWVLEWGRAPARYGGEGALVVFLKGRK